MRTELSNQEIQLIISTLDKVWMSPDSSESQKKEALSLSTKLIIKFFKNERKVAKVGA